MCLSIFLAQVIGCYLVLVGLAMLIHQNRFKKLINDFLSHSTLISLSSSICLIFGLLIIADHNVWVGEWPMVITIIGWILILKGILRLFFPDAFVKLMKDLTEKSPYMVMCWVRILVGLYLVWAGFSQ
jgi:uncharacterized protein YjeT (DUF2065 family)